LRRPLGWREPRRGSQSDQRSRGQDEKREQKAPHERPAIEGDATPTQRGCQRPPPIRKSSAATSWRLLRNDKVSGLAGKDTICGGSGKDTLKGGKGNDKLFGQAGKDTLKGGPGKDKLKGGAGKDKLIQ
jgi:RTX calcium-binding nonapeptide repeat (4 copies)